MCSLFGVNKTDVMAAVGAIKTKRTIQFVDWMPTGMKCGISYQPITMLQKMKSLTMTNQAPQRALLLLSHTTQFAHTLRHIIQYYKRHSAAATSHSSSSASDNSAMDSLQSLYGEYLQVSEEALDEEEDAEGEEEEE